MLVRGLLSLRQGPGLRKVLASSGGRGIHPPAGASRQLSLSTLPLPPSAFGRTALASAPAPRPALAASLLGASGLCGGLALTLRPAVAEAAPLAVAEHSCTVANLESAHSEGRSAWQFGRICMRILELLWQLAPLLLSLPLIHTPMRARWLRLLVRTLERCGPVGIKWGQWASTRYDLFEDDICDSLGALTNAAPAHDFGHTERVVREAFGASIDELFTEFEESPIASGSGASRPSPLRHLSA